MRKLLKVVLLLLLPFSKLYAQQMLTVDDAIAAALKNNFDIRLLRNDSAAYALDNKYAYAAFLPRVNAATGLSFNNNATNQRLADGSKRNATGLRTDNINAAVTLNWTLFDGFKLFATKEKLAQFVRLGELNIKNQLVNTIASVITTYYNIVRQKQQLKAIDEQMKLNVERAALAEKKLSVGLGAKPELLQAKVDLNAQKAARLKQLTLQEQLKEQLNLLLSFKQGTDYDVADSIPFDKNIIVTDVLYNAEKNNPALLLARQNITISNLALKEKKADLFPIVTFNTGYNFSRTNNAVVVNNFTPLFNQTRGLNYGLGISVPVFNGFAVRRQIKQAQLDIKYQELKYDFEKFKTDIAISRAYKDYLLQQKTLALEEENIILAKENVFISSERLRLGITTSLELRETQKSLEDAYNRLIAARYDTKVAETELKRLQGELVVSIEH